MSRAERIKLHQARIDKIISENERRRLADRWRSADLARKKWEAGQAYETTQIYQSAQNAQPVPISNPNTPERFTSDDQGYMLLRALFASSVLASPLDQATTVPVSEFRRTPRHDEIRERLSVLLDRQSSQSECLFLARLTPSGDKYEVLVSTCETSYSESGGPLDLDDGMKLALQTDKTIVNDFSITTPAVYVPRKFRGTTAGFLVMTKRSWGSDARRVNAVTTSPGMPVYPSEERMASLEKWVVDLEKRVAALERQTTSTRVDR